MEQINRLDLLTLVVALSVYIATIRLVVIGRLLGEEKLEERRKARYKLFLLTLVPGDALLVVSGFLLFLDIFWADLFGGTAPGWFETTSVWTFFIAGGLLVVHHLVAWVRSVGSLPAVWGTLRQPRPD
jgi:hypothetical protein